MRNPPFHVFSAAYDQRGSVGERGGVESELLKKKNWCGAWPDGGSKESPRGAWSLPQKLTSSLKEMGCGCVLWGERIH